MNIGATDPNSDLLSTAPGLRRELKVDLRKQKGLLVAIVEDPVRSRFFQVGNVEYHFLMMLDGKRTVQEIVQAMQHGRGYEQFDVDSARKICEWLSNMNLLDTAGGQTTGRLCQAAQAKEKQKWFGLLNPVSFRVNLINPDQSLAKIKPFTQWLFSPLCVIVWVLAGIYAYSLVSSDYDRFTSAAAGILSSERWIWLLLIWVVLKIIHETAHGIACKKYGGNVPSAGMLVLLFAPLAFVNVTSSWRFSSRFQRMVVSAAGMYVELFLAFVGIIVWYYAESQILSDLAYNVVIMAGVSTVLFNANPLLRFDGYYLLADLVEIVNLYGKGQAWFGDRTRHLLFGFPIDTNVCPKPELNMVRFYGICSFVWRIVLCVSLLLVASTLLGGAGLALAAIGAIFWVWMPLIQNVKKVTRAAQDHPIQKTRVAFCGALAVGLGLLAFFGLQAPAMTTAPAIVQFKDEQILRAGADGFIQNLLVVDGQSVAKGAVLLQIQNPDLCNELETLKKSVESARIQARIHQQQGELSLQQAELSRIESIQKQILEKQSQVDQLQVVAPFDGMVFQRGLSNRIGDFVKQGDELMSFADPSQKEVLVSIDQEQIKSVKNRVSPKVRFLFAGAKRMSSKIDSIEPRATDVPVHSSMTAAMGGSLPVRPAANNESQNDEFRLISPRFTARSNLSKNISRRLAAGQRGRAFIEGRQISVGGFLVLQCRNWIRSKLQTATQGSF